MKKNLLQKTLLSFFVVFSLFACFNRESSIIPSDSLSKEESSKRISKALYNSIELEYRGKKNLQQLITASIDKITSDENEEFRKNANDILNKKEFKELFSSAPLNSKQGRTSGEELNSINLDKMKDQINSKNSSQNIRKKLIEYSSLMSDLKNRLGSNSD
jgi:hypothetical protein